MPTYQSSIPVAGFVPGDGAPGPVFDFQKREQDIAQRKRKLAELMKMGLTPQPGPQGQMVSGHYVAPSIFQQLAPLAKQLAGQYAAGQEEKGLATDTAEYDAADRRAAIEHALSRPTARTEQDAPQDIGGNMIQGPERTVTPTQQDMAAWAQQGASIPSRRDVVKQLLTDIEVNAPVRAEANKDKQADREDRQVEARAKLASDEAFRRDKLKEDSAREAQRQSDAQAMRVLIAQGQQTSNELRREQIKAAMEGKTAAETASHAKERQEVTGQARDAQERMELLNSAAKAGETATGSGLGSARDWAASIFGHSTEGAKGAAKLKALQAQLLTLTPKLGGSTSDADVRNYREAVGQIGDDTLPMETRQAAMDTVQAINQRDYSNALARGQEFQARTQGKPGSGTATPKQVRTQADVDRLPKGTTFVGPDGKTYRKD